MAFQYDAATRNAWLDSIETTTGTTPDLLIYSGTVPATTATAASGTLLATIALPSDWMAAASGGTKAKAGTWTGTGAAGAGTGTDAGYFRIRTTGAGTVRIQGTITVTGGGGDMTLNNTSIASGQAITIDTFTLTANGA